MAQMSEDEIERLAREEILKEAKRALERANQVGPQGWMKCPIPSANKRFLRYTLMQAKNSSSRSRSSASSSDRVETIPIKRNRSDSKDMDDDRHGSHRKRRSDKPSLDVSRSEPSKSRPAKKEDEKYISNKKLTNIDDSTASKQKHDR